MTPTPTYTPGLEGVIAGETAISSIQDGLRYRGYPVGELVDKATFDEVAYLLLYGDLPKAGELKTFRARLSAARSVPEPLRALLRALPKQTPGMDALRSSISVLAHFDPDTADLSQPANLRKAERLLGQIPVAVAEQYRLSKGQQPVPPRADLGHSANFLYMVRGKEPSAEETRAFDLSLILYAEHEFNASTFTARVITSTEADLHSAICGAVGALKGALHGGANEKVMDILRAAGGPDTTAAWLN